MFAKGSINYEKRRLIHNGLCTKIYPDIIVVPESTNDVSAIVKITNKHKVAISIRSGGHSYTCQSTKQGNNFIRFVHRKILFLWLDIFTDQFYPTFHG